MPEIESENEISDERPCGFTVWVDADACPRDVQDLLLRNAARRGVPTVFVANSHRSLPELPCVSFQLVPSGADKADDFIVEKAGRLDVAVTGDIPLAARLVEKGIAVLGTRGEEMTSANIGERLAMRNLMEELRSAGLPTGGPKEFDKNDAQRFANALDRFIARRSKK